MEAYKHKMWRLAEGKYYCGPGIGSCDNCELRIFLCESKMQMKAFWAGAEAMLRELNVAEIEEVAD